MNKNRTKLFNNNIITKYRYHLTNNQNRIENQTNVILIRLQLSLVPKCLFEIAPETAEGSNKYYTTITYHKHTPRHT